jgi:hypothetical protein
MPPIRRLAKLAAAVLGFGAYLWYSAVRQAPQVKRKKAGRR